MHLKSRVGTAASLKNKLRTVVSWNILNGCQHGSMDGMIVTYKVSIIVFVNEIASTIVSKIIMIRKYHYYSPGIRNG